MDPTQDAQIEVTRKYKATATTVLGMIVAVVLLSIVAYLAGPHLTEQPSSPFVDYAVRILILFLGLGAIAWRRTRFAAPRLQAVAGLGGIPGLVRTLEKTTIQIALIADATAVFGLAVTLITGDPIYTYMAGAIALMILVVYFPTKSSWVRTVARYSEEQPDAPPAPPTFKA